MTHRRRQGPVEDRWSVQTLSTDGIYPKHSIIVDDFAVLAVEDGLVWSAVHFPFYPHEDGALISWLTPEEIRFYSSISLAEPHPEDHGRPRICARSYGGELVLTEAVTSEGLKLASKAVAEKLGHDMGPYGVVPQVRLEPYTLDRDYTTASRTLLDSMDPLDPLLLRGLYKFLIATDMMRFPHLHEEAALAAFISREAALELLRRSYSLQEGRRLKKDDIIKRIQDEWPTGVPFTEVLETDWEARVMMVHPVSDYGEFWSPPVEAEECYDALNSLIHLYRYLLLSEPWNPFDC